MSMASPNLTVMINAARKAARGLARDFGEVENLQVSVKGPGDFVSAADRRAEKTIREELARARPAYGFLGEEGGAVAGADGMHTWIVDPLDGTSNFLHGIPHWAISIALERKGELVAGVVYDVAKDELFTAERGSGAWMNNRRLRVSGRRELSQMLFGTGIPFMGSRELPRTLRDLAHLMPRCAGVRRNGAASLDLAWVAAGRFDGFWERRLNAWDIAAGVLLVREAGGVVRDPDRDDLDPMATGSVAAASPEVIDGLTAMLRAD